MVIMEELLNLMLLLSLSGTYFASPTFAYWLKHDAKPRPLIGRPQQRPQQEHLFSRQSQYISVPQQPSFPNIRHERVKTINVKCNSDLMEIVVKADMFDLGFAIDENDLRLGVEEGDLCRATKSSANEYTIFARLLDCGTKHWVTEDSVIYTNLLIYSPMTSSDGVIRMEDAVIPIECQYGRKYSLTSDALQPTWIPFTATVSADESLVFDMKIMSSDWLYDRGSRVFFLGDLINIEASVRVAHHMRLRIFINSCVATLDPDRKSVPRYVFIDNDGCLVDSQLLGSRSRFMSRTQDDTLQFQIDAFMFHQEHRGELFITCHLTAAPVTNAEPHNKACSYIDGRWRSADGIDFLCGRCQRQNKADASPRIQSGYETSSPYGQDKPQTSGFWKSGMKKGLEQETLVGPISVFQSRQKSALFAPRGRGGIPAFFNPGAMTTISPGSLWKDRIDFKRGSLFPTLEPREPEDLTEVEDLTKGLEPEDLTEVEDLTKGLEPEDLTEVEDLTKGLEQEAEDDLTEDAGVTVSTRRNQNITQNLNITLQSSDKGATPDDSSHGEETLGTTLPNVVTPALSVEGRNHTEEITPALKSLKDTDSGDRTKENDPIKR